MSDCILGEPPSVRSSRPASVTVRLFLALTLTAAVCCVSLAVPLGVNTCARRFSG